jgi:hypothetical protein
MTLRVKGPGEANEGESRDPDLGEDMALRAGTGHSQERQVQGPGVQDIA